MSDLDYPAEDTLDALVELLHDLRRASTLEAALQRIVETAVVLTPAEGASVRLFDERHVNFVAVARCGSSVHERPDVPMPPDEGLIGWVAKHARPALIEDTREDERFARRADQARDVRSLICAPMYSRGEVLGVLGGWHTEPGAFRPVHLDYLQLLANCGTPSIEVARLERLARAPRDDGATS
ncbi:MAG: GAF domain-containing protein [Deltaproteobacteria bacterium]|nr:GAF domain-containing protein [Deltaproteobacteria bacterium]